MLLLREREGWQLNHKYGKREIEGWIFLWLCFSGIVIPRPAVLKSQCIEATVFTHYPLPTQRPLPTRRSGVVPFEWASPKEIVL